MHRPHWSLMDLAIAIAVLAVSFTAMGVTGTAIAIALLLPSALARPGQRLTAAAWMMAIGPTALHVLAHYFVWGMVCYYEGGRPAFISDPFIENVHNTPIFRVALKVVRVSEVGSFLSLFVSFAIAWIRSLKVWKHNPKWKGAFCPFFAVPFAWVVGSLLLLLGPTEVADWFFD